MPEEGLSQEDRLKALVYQFIALYERWSEDRQVAAKHGADQADLLQQFLRQVEQFKGLVPTVREDLQKSLREEIQRSVTHLENPLRKQTEESIRTSLSKLDNATYNATQALNRYQSAHADAITTTGWKIAGASIVTAVLLAALVLKYIVPPPLTSEQIMELYDGQLLHRIFYRLSSSEKAHWKALIAEDRG